MAEASTMGATRAPMEEAEEDSDYEASPKRKCAEVNRRFTEGDDSDYEPSPIALREGEEYADDSDYEGAGSSGDLTAALANWSAATVGARELPKDLEADDSDYECNSPTDVNDAGSDAEAPEPTPAPAPAPSSAPAATKAPPRPPPAPGRADGLSDATAALLEKCINKLRHSDAAQHRKQQWRDLPAHDDLLQGYEGSDVHAKIASFAKEHAPGCHEEIECLLVKALALVTPRHNDLRSFLTYVNQELWTDVLGHLCVHVLEWGCNKQNRAAIQSCLTETHRTLQMIARRVL